MFLARVLISDDGFHYTCQTADIARRLREQNEKRNHATKHGSGWERGASGTVQHAG